MFALIRVDLARLSGNDKVTHDDAMPHWHSATADDLRAFWEASAAAEAAE